MIVNEYGLVGFDSEELIEALYNGIIDNLDGVYMKPGQSWPFNRAVMLNGDKFPQLTDIHNKIPLPENQYFYRLRKEWFIPEDYKNIDIEQKVLDKCTNSQQLERVKTEIKKYKSLGMYDVLVYLNYLVDVMREHKIVWGVGRGSSVASYVLYLLGVHKIDSIKYELDMNEFFKGDPNG